MIKSTLLKKKIGEKNYKLVNITEEQVKQLPEKELLYVLPKYNQKVIRRSNYFTDGEDLIIIKGIDHCKLILDSDTTNHIIIKALTKVLIIPSQGQIDDYYDEIFIERGACVEFILVENVWYILSSDGVKLT